MSSSPNGVEALAARLDHYYRQIKAVILDRQDPVTGLLPASTAVNAHGDYTDAWVRDNVYSILAAWGLGLAYRKLDSDQGRTYELEGHVTKLMRGLLFAMMRQAQKVERFKHSQSPTDSLHAKYSTRTGGTVVGDNEWGHLQLDATSLFLLMLGQMTASGLHIVYTIDEVNFVQNLIYYIGRAYQTPDYGIWERGNKLNSGSTELNASSIGMAKAALEALNGLNLFGVRGSQASVVHVLPDEIARARMTLESLLPWESRSKEVDAALLGIIGFPAFAVEDVMLVVRTRSRVMERLHGRYGCKRFLRDGHQTVVEDTGRLHYESWELKQFENIECEWPLFYTYLLLDCIFRDDVAGAREYRQRLDALTVERDGLRLLPELYFVPREHLAAERLEPHSQAREPNENVPLVWAQSLYYLGQMLQEGLLQRGDIDPVGRHRQVGIDREPVVQIALLAEDETLQVELESHGIASQTTRQIEPIQVRHGSALAAAYNYIGRNAKLSLTGRPVRRLRSLTTSKVFRIRGEVMVFLPAFLDPQQFYLTLDERVLVEQMKSELTYMRNHWRQPGRPTMTLMLTRTMWRTGRNSLLKLIGELQQGQCGGVRVRLGPIHQLQETAGKERIDYLHDFEFSQSPVSDMVSECRRLLADPVQDRPLTQAEEFQLERETDVGKLLESLRASSNIYLQAELLQALSRVVGLGFDTGWGSNEAQVTVADLIEEVYVRASHGGIDQKPYWSVVRQATGLLGKIEVSLSDAVTEILVRQKQITVGKAYFEDAVITRPLLPHEIMEKIRKFAGEDVRELALTQEILVFFGLMIKAERHLFADLLTLRAGYLILLITSELADELGLRQEEAYDRLMYLSPSEVEARLRGVLGDRDAKAGLLRRQESLAVHGGVLDSVATAVPARMEESTAPPGGWLRRRQRDGFLNRVPDEFYGQVWNLLHHCHGLVIGDKLERRNRLDSAVVLSEMTEDEGNFAVWIEHLLNKIEFPEYRQLNIEAIQALANVVAQSPELRIGDFITLDVLIGHAVRLAWIDLVPGREDCGDEDKPAAWRHFYETSPRLCETFIVKALGFLAGRDIVATVPVVSVAVPEIMAAATAK